MNGRALINNGRWQRSLLLALSFVLIALATACAKGSQQPLADLGTPGIGKEEGAPVGSVKKDGSTPKASAASSKKGSSAGSSGGKARAVDASPSPFVPAFPSDPAVKVDAVLTPTCAHHGTKMTLVVETNSQGAVGYQAIYSDNVGGGPEPYGAGYGGNGKGMADKSGHFTSSWVISNSAPAGVARLDIAVGWEGKFGYRSLTFHVGPDSACK